MTLHARAAFLFVMLAAASPAAQAPPAPDLAALVAKAELVDLTHTFNETTLVWPTSDPMRLEKVADGVTAGGWYYASNIVHLTEHGGTHLDAPVHFAAGQTTADKVELSRLVGDAVVIDVSAQSAKDVDYLISVDDLRRWEATHGRISRGSRVLFRTGWSARWPDAVRYLGTALKGAEGVAQLHFPGLAPDLATFLVKERQISLVGIDTASMDRGQSTTFETHRILAAAGVPGLENLTNLDKLPARGAVLFALSMKVGGGSGGPLRAVAVVPR
ncbi:Kynurenine formamidase [Luteitalea pratensis]|uniref:Kynurenine formamidase n=1 Tax=Luteitalea pratensis TaxID=1855912 RepID=A0A143PJI1_LUTPR|nr:cyclase family protein [Luteitalea pratensis]AMY08661.1 Kynurenine formamidase [Luteitalea pratensis]